MKDENYDKSIPKYYLGLSMGALVDFFTVLKNPSYFKGILMLNPAFSPNYDYSYLPKIFVYYIGQYLIPRL
jgi:hypothetical protein